MFTPSGAESAEPVGLDAFLSVPADRFVAAARAFKAATAEASVSDAPCNLVCVPPLATVEEVAGRMANALSVTDSTKLKIFVYQAVRSIQSGDPQQLKAAAAEARRFEASLNQAEVRRVTRSVFDLLDAAGADLSPSEVAWVNGFVGLT